MGPEKPEQHVTQKYTGTLVGRYANRVSVTPGPVTVSRNGFTSTFTAQANERPEVSLHGGVVGFDSLPFTPLADLSESKLFTPEEVATLQAEMPTAVVLTRVSPDGEQGFPGTLRVEFLVGLIPPKGPAAGDKSLLGSLVLIYRARLEEPNKVTPINLTQVRLHSLPVSFAYLALALGLQPRCLPRRAHCAQAQAPHQGT